MFAAFQCWQLLQQQQNNQQTFSSETFPNTGKMFVLDNMSCLMFLSISEFLYKTQQSKTFN